MGPVAVRRCASAQRRVTTIAASSRGRDRRLRPFRRRTRRGVAGRERFASACRVRPGPRCSVGGGKRDRRGRGCPVRLERRRAAALRDRWRQLHHDVPGEGGRDLDPRRPGDGAGRRHAGPVHARRQPADVPFRRRRSTAWRLACRARSPSSLSRTRPVGDLAAVRHIEAAQRLAENGFEINEFLAREIREHQAKLSRIPETAAIFLPGGVPLQEGNRLVQPELALDLPADPGSGRRRALSGRDRVRNRPDCRPVRRPDDVGRPRRVPCAGTPTPPRRLPWTAHRDDAVTFGGVD